MKIYVFGEPDFQFLIEDQLSFIEKHCKTWSSSGALSPN